MSKKKSADEHSKDKIAKRVVTPKRRYFLPEAGREVEAEELANVQEALNKEAEVGDGNK